MRNIISALLIAVLMIGLTTGCGSSVNEQDPKNDASEQDSKKEVKRVGMVIKINPEYIEEYGALHSDSNAGVRDLLTKAHMHNFSIFLHQLDDGNWYEFGYYEYTAMTAKFGCSS